ncbi:MAG: hypothetical protein ACRENP_10370 [Longimicrobiales bacterium]
MHTPYTMALRTLAPLGFCLFTTGSLPLAESPPPHARASSALVLTVSPGLVAGGNTVNATITLDAPATGGGVEVTLSSLTPTVADFDGVDRATGTLKVLIKPGSTSSAARVRTFGQSVVTAASLRASIDGNTATASLTVTPPSVSSLEFFPAAVTGGSATTGTIRLDGVAPANGIPVQITNSSAVLLLPATVSVPPGVSQVTFGANTMPVQTDATATVSANIQGTPRSATVTVRALSLSSVQLSPRVVTGGSASSGTVVLSGAAVGRPVTVSLTSSSSEATVPALLSIGPGTDRANFTILTQTVSNVRTVTIRAQLGGSGTPPGGSGSSTTSGITDGTSNTIIIGEPAGQVSASVSLTIEPSTVVTASAIRVQSIAAQPSSVQSGLPVAITVTLESAAPEVTTNLPVSIGLTSSQPQLLQIPTRVIIPAGSRTGSVNGTTSVVSVDQTVTITTGGTAPVSTTLLLKPPPPPVASFTLRPTTVKGGVNVIAQLTPSSGVTRPVEVKLTTDHPELISVPASVQLSPSTPLALTFTTTVTKTETPVTITASVGSQSVPVKVTITP